MASKKISELPSADTPLDGTELFEIVQGGINKKVAKDDVSTGGAGAVDSVNGQTGVVVLDAGDVGADPAGTANAKVADAINNGVTTIAPSQNAVFDALALKAPLDSPTFTTAANAPTPSQGDNDTSIATTAFVNAEILADAPRGFAAVAATGAVVSFAIPQYYGSASAITGNITFSTTGAILGMEQVMRHNDSSEPSFPSDFKRMEGSRNYVTGVDNYIYMKYLSATKVQYTINQEQ